MEVIDMFMAQTVAMASPVILSSKLIRSYVLNMYNFSCVDHTSIKWYKKKKEKILMGWPILQNVKNTINKCCHSHLQGSEKPPHPAASLQLAVMCALSVAVPHK